MREWIIVPTANDECPMNSPDRGVFVQQQQGPAIGNEFLRLITRASLTIDIMNPLVTDSEVLQALIQARSRGVRVRVITELRDNRSSRLKYPTLGFEVLDTSTLKDHFEAVRALTRQRVLCRGLTHYAHAKLMIVDRCVLFISSVNLTPNSLGWGPTMSFEAGIRIEGTANVDSWTRAFATLWASCPLRLHLLETDVSLQQEGTPGIEVGRMVDDYTVRNGMTWSLPDKHYGIRDALVRLCDEAAEWIAFSALSFYETDHIPLLHCAIQRALRRGVKVTAVIRPEHFKPEQYPDHSTLVLLEQGLQLLGRTGLHAKGAAADGTHTLIFSANVNPFSLESSERSAHVECAMWSKSTSGPLTEYGRLIQWIAEHPTHCYMTH